MKAFPVATYWRQGYPSLLQSQENMMELSDSGTCYVQIDTCIHISGYSSGRVSGP